MDRREHNHINNSFTPPGGSSHCIVFATRFATLPHHEADTQPEIPDYMVLTDAGSIPAAASIFNMIFLVKNTQVNGLTSS